MKKLKKSKEMLKRAVAKANSKLKPKKKSKPAKILNNRSNKDIPSFQETAIIKTKFSHAENIFPLPIMPQELPSTYDQDKIILQVRDPRWLHAYWELRNQTLENLKSNLGEDFYRAKKVLRVYDVTSIIFNGTNANSFFDITINGYANSWYIDTNGPGRSWCLDLGLMLPNGKFITILRSNVVQTPIDGPSWITDEEWMIPDDMFARLYGMGFGLGRSSPVGGAWQERIKQGLFSSGLSSSPVKKESNTPTVTRDTK
ncbi:MAG: DUF4912 domain-containing protein [Candidatus Omnitrophota bacterium]